MVGGGDGYPFPCFGPLNSRFIGSQQGVLAEYLGQHYGEEPFDQAETEAAFDQKIQEVDSSSRP